MCSVPAAAARTKPVDAAAASSDSSGPVSFLKDGRKISVGDCALFQSGNSPPFIGIIRSLTSSDGDYPKLGVNWLYRPSDIKIGKGILLEAAPNEVFYSFHKDEISAASLLHPCKVAFLRKGVELPSGISSFVCRRVYDIQNRCLWWLTDQDYINERQEEVDQLLDKTGLEMHAAVQSGARSPKPLNGPTSTQQLKSGSESVQNSTTSFPSQGKGRKRERGDQGQEPIKRERYSRADDGDSSHYKLESMIKAEIAKITNKGGLVNSEGVDKLVHLIHLDRADKKIDLAGRIMLTDVIAATEKPDCLDRFVELKGIPVLDDWLQEAHKGKAGDGNSPKENDKFVEEFLLVLLRALDKLPVNLHALQSSNVGKSVNNLRSHKNLEIQKKARSLVDTWKKRVDLEMKMNDAKSASGQSVSWPGKAGFSESPHGGNRRSGSSEVAIKSIVTQPSASKTGSVKLSHGDAVARSASVSPGSMKLAPSSPVSATTGSKELHCKVAGGSSTTEMPLTSIKEEKSSSSSQSQNNSQSCSSDHAKYSCKKDARSSTAGSVNAKTSSGASRTRKSNNGFLGSGAAGVQKESGLGKPSVLNRDATPDKSSQVAPVCERSVDMPTVDHGNSHRLIVRLPNRGRSPAQSTSGGSFEDPSAVVSRASSPGVSDKQDHHERKAKGKSETARATVAAGANMDSWKSIDVKNGFAGSDGGDRSAATVLEEEHIRNTVENVKSMDSSKAVCLSSGNEKGALPKSGKLSENSFSINALIESCVKFSEASSSLSVGDDIGMNLLASVATGEMPKSEPVSPSRSPEISSPARDETLTGNSAKLRSLHDDAVAHGHGQLDDNAYSDSEKQGKSVGPPSVSGASKEISTSEPGNLFLEHKLAGKHSEELPSSTVELHQAADMCLNSDGEPGRTATDGGAGSTCSTANGTPSKDLKEEFPESEGIIQPCEEKMISVSVEDTDDVSDAKLKVINGSPGDSTTVDFAHEKAAERSICVSLGSQSDTEQVTASCIKVENEGTEESPSSLMANEKMDMEHERLPGGLAMMRQLPPVVAGHVEDLDRSGEDAVAPPGSLQCPEIAADSNLENADYSDKTSKFDPIEVERIEQTTPEINHTTDNTENSERKEVTEDDPSSSAPHEEPLAVPAQQNDQCMKSGVSKLSVIESDEIHKTEECISTAEASSFINATGPDMAAKLDFDLNEGFAGDEVNTNDFIIPTTAVCTSTAHLPSRTPHPASPLHGVLPASITVAAAAKGPFVPPENLLRSKGELGWKGSASTSAFRRAEPRKVLEMPLSTTTVTSNDTAAGKRSLLPLDIDLNVPVQRIPEDMASRSSFQESVSGSGTAINSLDLGNSMMMSSSSAVRGAGGLDLDLNRADESTENGQLFASTSRRIEVPSLPVRSSSSCGFSNDEVNKLRNFDLNNGPGLDEVGLDYAPRSQLAKGNGPFPPHVTGLRTNNSELGSVSSWFPPGTSYPNVAHQSFLPDRGEQPYPFLATTGAQRMLASATTGSFGGDLYRGPVLSSPAMAFSPAVPFPYAGFPFGNSFPLASTSFSGGSTPFMDSFSGGGPCFPATPSQLVGPAGAISSHYPRPYAIGLPESSTSTGDGGWKWGRQGLDLNAGPGSTDAVARDDRLTSISGQLSAANPQGLTDEQARVFQSTSGPLKRKESEGGCDTDRSSYKSSWQ
ncbi:hypothetical protein MRB53_011521 [Persea americana]|uniref:Uncharacterized protein n=1 Tax=Persea americana TaxID=3435 RepID=A0ACC2LV03_PERAE|nr:hypothetical protein MRB53_011521 [Persea americana]